MKAEAFARIEATLDELEGRAKSGSLTVAEQVYLVGACQELLGVVQDLSAVHETIAEKHGVATRYVDEAGMVLHRLVPRVDDEGDDA